MIKSTREARDSIKGDNPDKWVCYRCNKINFKSISSSCTVCNCNNKSFLPSSYVNTNICTPHVLHGDFSDDVRPEQLQDMINRGFDINRGDSQGWTPLISVSRKGRADLVTTLLELGAMKEAKTREGWNALHHAVDAGQIRSVQALLKHNFPVNDRIGVTGDTALHIASRSGRADIIHVLLSEEGGHADISVTTTELQQTPLHLAVFHQHVSAVQTLLAHGADVTALDHESTSVYQIAMMEQNSEIQLILREIGDAVEDDFNMQDLMDSVKKDRDRNRRIFGV